MNAQEIAPILGEVLAVIDGMDEREAFALLIESGVSFSLTTKLVAKRYRASSCRDKTTEQFKKFLSLAKAS
jgi:hypothetical protein